MRRPPRPGEPVVVKFGRWIYYVYVRAHRGMWLHVSRDYEGGSIFHDRVNRFDEGRTWARLENEASFRTVCALTADPAA